MFVRTLKLQRQLCVLPSILRLGPRSFSVPLTRNYYNNGRSSNNNNGRFSNNNRNNDWNNQYRGNNSGRNNQRYNNGNNYNSRGKFNRGRQMQSKSDPERIILKQKLTVVGKDEQQTTLDQLKEENLLDDAIVGSIQNLGFESLTPVQEKTIKPILKSEDVDIIARAKTGTGKTFAFLLPIFQHLLSTMKDKNTTANRMVQAVIVAPTRDLALQIEQEIYKLYKNDKKNILRKNFPCISLVGGTNVRQSIMMLRRFKPSIVIATPGRLIATLEDEILAKNHFTNVDFKVLDEADRLLEIGFKEDLEHISEMLNTLNTVDPKHIRTLLFSATLDQKVQKLANTIMNKEEALFLDTVDPNEPEAHENIDQKMIVSENFSHNIYAIVDHIQAQIDECKEKNEKYKAILFTPTVKFTTLISRILGKKFYAKDRLPIIEFHGKVAQNRRTRLVNQFKKMDSGVLVCTDVGARGMDFPNVKEVLQIGVPTELANYVHRIGRTARAGSKGISTIFLSKHELPFVDSLKNLKNIEIKDSKNYVPNENVINTIRDDISHGQHLSDIFIGLLSYYKTLIKEYNLRERQILTDIAKSYGQLLADEENKIQVSNMSFLKKIGLGSLANSTLFEGVDYNSSFDYDDNNYNNNRYNSNNRYGNNRGYSNNSNRYNDNYNNRNNNDSVNSNDFMILRGRSGKRYNSSNNNNNNFERGSRRSNGNSTYYSQNSYERKQGNSPSVDY